jgi:hypothetical protein
MGVPPQWLPCSFNIRCPWVCGECRSLKSIPRKESAWRGETTKIRRPSFVLDDTDEVSRLEITGGNIQSSCQMETIFSRPSFMVIHCHMVPKRHGDGIREKWYKMPAEERELKNISDSLDCHAPPLIEDAALTVSATPAPILSVNMKQSALFSLGLLGLASAQTCGSAPVDQLVGYAAGTTGGGSGSGTTVTSCSALKSAIANAGVIKISGTLSGCGIMDLKGATTVLGVGANSGTGQPPKQRLLGSEC